MNLRAEEIKRLLGLQPHPTCGFVAETYRSSMRIPIDGLPSSYEGERPWGSALYFLVTPEAQIVLHRIRSDQLYHHYVGDPLDVLMLLPDGSDAVVTVGADLSAGMRPQLFIPGGTFHISRLHATTGYALLASTEWPGVEPADVEHGEIDEVSASFPKAAQLIREFARSHNADASTADSAG